ncbi:RHS repeat-associated core domain-containing protein [Pontibacter sp. G13]|uniref:RHS repeat-associated core domain-containing protein n=1 Tax=Pontibacter sp. G13 TaxID=3074898 RepID=UPI002889B18F|nr:RHS repeat-associated core domain-containing protein [Pontibacter sp. G13]WNJ17197.1 RHS repeat-associated core domain-containing protein [Pontibacter sp. G13]
MVGIIWIFVHLLCGIVPEYFLKDHLDNTRVVFTDANADGVITVADDVLSRSSYYPYGLSMHGGGTYAGTIEQRYGYNGKELQDDHLLGWIDYGARMMDPTIGRWNGVDALAEQYQAWSPYNYTLGNPIRFIDPDGNSVGDPIKLPTGTKIQPSDRAGVINAYVKELSMIAGAVQEVNTSNGKDYESTLPEKAISHLKTGIEAFLDGSDVEFEFGRTLESSVEQTISVRLEAYEGEGMVESDSNVDIRIGTNNSTSEEISSSIQDSHTLSGNIEASGGGNKGGLNYKVSRTITNSIKHSESSGSSKSVAYIGTLSRKIGTVDFGMSVTYRNNVSSVGIMTPLGFPEGFFGNIDKDYFQFLKTLHIIDNAPSKSDPVQIHVTSDDDPVTNSIR